MKLVSVMVVLAGLCAMLAGCGCGRRAQNEIYIVSKTGLQFCNKAPGSGPVVEPYDRVSINFIGRYEDGKVFESTLRPNKAPYIFGVSDPGVPAGLREGVIGMQVGGKRELKVPPDLMHCAIQDEYFFPKDKALTFDIQLLKINP